MKYQYIAIYSIKGLHLPNDENDKILVDDSINGVRAVLANDPDPYLSEVDRSFAVAHLLLQVFFGMTKFQSNDFPSRVENELKEIKEQRKKDFGKGPFLLAIMDGDILHFNPSRESETEKFVICFQGTDKDVIRASCRPFVTAIINAISSLAQGIIKFEEVNNAVVFFREDGKPIYSYTSKGSADLLVSKKLPEEQIPKIEKFYHLLLNDKTFQRVQLLLRSSFETGDDTFRSFISAWAAFEIFVNKIFPFYEKNFFKGFVEEAHTEAQKKFLERVREVMKGKYRLADKFAAISFQLSPQTADGDLKSAVKIKNIRDSIAHGKLEEDPHQEQVETIRNLAMKYFRLFTEKEHSNI